MPPRFHNLMVSVIERIILICSSHINTNRCGVEAGDNDAESHADHIIRGRGNKEDLHKNIYYHYLMNVVYYIPIASL